MFLPNKRQKSARRLEKISVEKCDESTISALLQHDFFTSARTHILKENNLSSLQPYVLAPFVRVRSLVLIKEPLFKKLSVTELTELPSLDSIGIFGGCDRLSIDAAIFNPDLTKLRALGIDSKCALNLCGSMDRVWLKVKELHEFIMLNERPHKVFTLSEHAEKVAKISIVNSEAYRAYKDKFTLSPVLSSIKGHISSVEIEVSAEQKQPEDIKQKTEALYKNLGITKPLEFNIIEKKPVKA